MQSGSPQSTPFEFASTADQGNPHNLLMLVVGKRANVQTQRSGSKLLHTLSGFASTQDSAACLTNVVGFQPRHCLHWVISQVMQLRGVMAPLGLHHLQYLIASIGKSLQGFVNFWTQFLRDYQLALNRQSLTHSPIIVHPNCRRLMSLFVFPLCSKEARVSKRIKYFL